MQLFNIFAKSESIAESTGDFLPRALGAFFDTEVIYYQSSQVTIGTERLVQLAESAFKNGKKLVVVTVDEIDTEHVLRGWWFMLN